MKKASLCLIYIIICCTLCACSAIKALENITPKISVLCAPSSPILPSGTSLADDTLYTTEYVNAPNEELAALCMQQIADGCQVIVLATDSTKVCTELAIIAQNANIPLILLGACASDELMSSYDKLWHLGATDINGGELLGLATAEYFNSGKIADLNADGILQLGFVCEEGTKMPDALMQSAADLGVFSEDVFALPSISQEESYSAAALLLADNPQLELIASDSAANARGAALAASDASLNIPIVALGDKTALSALASDGILTTYCVYPTDAIFSACLSFISNILNGEAVISGTNIKMNENKSVLFSYENVSE